MNDNMIPNLRAVKNEADAAAVRAAPAVADEAALAGKPPRALPGAAPRMRLAGLDPFVMAA